MWQKMLLLVLLTLFSNVYSKDFGIHGQLFEIGEIDMLDQINSKLRNLMLNGGFETANSQMQLQSRAYIENPPAVQGIVKTTKPRTYVFDPTYFLLEDIKDDKGNIMHNKGMSLNPLEKIKIDKHLIFIDGTDEEQVKWLFKYKKQLSESIKIILVKGEPFKLMKTFKERFYFDQHGSLVKHLGIMQVPAVVCQDGLKLKIEEISIGTK